MKFLLDVCVSSRSLTAMLSETGHEVVSAGPPTGRTRLSDWLDRHAETVGARYASELARHYR